MQSVKGYNLNTCYICIENGIKAKTSNHISKMELKLWHICTMKTGKVVVVKAQILNNFSREKPNFMSLDPAVVAEWLEQSPQRQWLRLPQVWILLRTY